MPGVVPKLRGKLPREYQAAFSFADKPSSLSFDALWRRLLEAVGVPGHLLGAKAAVAVMKGWELMSGPDFVDGVDLMCRAAPFLTDPVLDVITGAAYVSNNASLAREVRSFRENHPCGSSEDLRAMLWHAFPDASKTRPRPAAKPTRSASVRASKARYSLSIATRNPKESALLDIPAELEIGPDVIPPISSKAGGPHSTQNVLYRPVATTTQDCIPARKVYKHVGLPPKKDTSHGTQAASQPACRSNCPNSERVTTTHTSETTNQASSNSAPPLPSQPSQSASRASRPLHQPSALSPSEPRHAPNHETSSIQHKRPTPSTQATPPILKSHRADPKIAPAVSNLGHTMTTPFGGTKRIV